MVGKTISHYKILSKLGAGGMGEVYLAEDTRLDRKVALKFLPLHFTADTESLARFEREAKATAALNHPNIITVHEIGDHENQTFIAMEYVHGESLRERMAEKLSLEEIIDLLTQICSGLGKAHEADVVHRDIKPENIMIDKDGRVRILDFGLAKLKGVTKLTREASTLGTLNYMSPEQFQALEVDHRTDIWSLGVILYEMITGELPFAGDYEAAVMYSVLNEDVAALTSLQFDVPSELEQILNKALVKSPDERYQQVDEMLADFERISGPALAPHDTGGSKSKHARRPFFMPAIVAILLLAMVGVSYLYFNLSALKTDEPPVSERKMLAVLPFENLGLPEDEYFADGMTDEIITRLSSLQGLGVIARNSAMQYKNSDKSIGQIGEELGVDYVLQGTIRWQKMSAGLGQVRVTPKLIKVSDATNLWANVYQRDMSDIFQVQSDIASSVVAAMNIKLLSPERQSLLSG